MPKNDLKNTLEAITGDISLNDIKDAIERLIISKKEVKDIIEQFLRDVDFWGKFRQHPLIRKAIDWGNTIKECRKSSIYREIQDKLVEIIEKQEVEIDDLLEIKDLLTELKSLVISFVKKQSSNVKQGLRHIHAPGSAARKEARNLYFGEKFTQDDLLRLASRLCNSIAFGESIGVYSENEDFMKEMRQLIESLGFGLPFKIERDKLRDIGIQEIDVNHPHVVLLKFIIWLRRRIDFEEDVGKKGIYLSILNRLRSASINIFFMPPDKEKWCTIFYPRLDFFIDNWIQRDEARRSLEMLVNNISDFIQATFRESSRRGEIEKTRNIIDLLMNNYEILCRRLIEYGVPDFYALRNLIDLIVDLSAKYDVKLHFKSLILAS